MLWCRKCIASTSLFQLGNQKRLHKVSTVFRHSYLALCFEWSRFPTIRFQYPEFMRCKFEIWSSESRFSLHNILVCVTDWNWSDHELISSTSLHKDPTGNVPCVTTAYKGKLLNGSVLCFKKVPISFRLPIRLNGYHFDCEQCFMMNMNASQVVKLYAKMELFNINHSELLQGTIKELKTEKAAAKEACSVEIWRSQKKKYRSRNPRRDQ